MAQTNAAAASAGLSAGDEEAMEVKDDTPAAPALTWVAGKVPAAEWIGSASALAIGIGMIFLLRQLARLYLRRAGERWQDPQLAERILQALRGPLSLLVFLYFALWAFDQFKAMPGTLWTRVHKDFYPTINGIVLLMLGFRLVDIVTHLLRRRWAAEPGALDEYWASILGWIGKGALLGVGGMMLLQQLGINILPLLTGAGFLGAAIALASQKTIANAIGSLEILLDRLFRIGDRIAFDQYDGFVSHMGLRSIRLAALTGEVITIPNQEVAGRQIRNFSREYTDKDGHRHKAVRTTLTAASSYHTPRAKLDASLATLRKIVTADSRVREVETGVQRFGVATIELEVVFWADYHTSTEYRKLVTDLHLAVKEAFDTAGLEFTMVGTVNTTRRPTTPGDD